MNQAAVRSPTTRARHLTGYSSDSDSVDITAFRVLQDSGWIREQRDKISDGVTAVCPVQACGGKLVPFDSEAPLGHPVGLVVPLPGGVNCSECGARSRTVVL